MSCIDHLSSPTHSGVVEWQTILVLVTTYHCGSLFMVIIAGYILEIDEIDIWTPSILIFRAKNDKKI